MKFLFEWNEKRKRRKKALYLRCRQKTQKYGKDILFSEGFLKSKEYVQHGSVSVHKHSLHVATIALILVSALRVKAQEKDLVRGALLHDYFQYDWHNKKVTIKDILQFYRMHGFTHPKTALSNANRDFMLSPREKDIIQKHMWPLTVNPPRCREAWIVVLADKYCSLKETFLLQKRKGYTKKSSRKK